MSGGPRIEELSPEAFRQVLPTFLASYVAEAEAAKRSELRVRELVSGWSDAVCVEVMERLQRRDPGEGVLPALPACRALQRVWAVDVVVEPELSGVEHLRHAMESGPTVILANHLAYFDASAADCALAWAGHADLADRVVAAAGPKVYQATFRRIAAMCLNTLPVPQSTSLAHTEKIPARELARQALTSLAAARKAVADGQALLLYPEGSRTRTGRMGSFLRGVHRYLRSAEEVAVVPCAISGTEQIMPLDARQLTPGPVRLAFGSPLRVGTDGGTREVLEAAFGSVAALLPADIRPAEGTPPLA